MGLAKQLGGSFLRGALAYLIPALALIAPVSDISGLSVLAMSLLTGATAAGLRAALITLEKRKGPPSGE